VGLRTTIGLIEKYSMKASQAPRMSANETATEVNVPAILL
jgi:hypothetical protein